MKRIHPVVCICASLLILVNASVWEGAAAVAEGKELPETGLSIATNSFPVNTVVDITNLNNGKTARVLTVSGLDRPGLLALLSKDAAGAIGIESSLPGRIRIKEPDVPAAGVTVVAAEARPPESTAAIDSALVIDSIQSIKTVRPSDDVSLAAPAPIFTAPLIASLEKGSCYLQIGAYSNADSVRAELAKLDAALPVAIMNAGTGDKPVYRILIGPVNSGEGGALLQRFRGSYQDAFLRQGN